MRSAAEFPESRGPLRAALRDPLAVTGLTIVLLVSALAILAPWVAPHDPLAQSLGARFQPPSAEYWLGTDQLGRDILSRLIHGARIALGIAVASVVIAGGLGTLLGLAAASGPRWLDALLVLLFDAMSSLPVIFFALAVITVLGPGTGTLILVVVLVSIPAYARLIRTQALGLVVSDFVQAERSMGAGPLRILFVHLLPNAIGPLVILICMDIPVVIMLEAGLSYLNLGVRPPQPSWGNMLAEGYASLRRAPHIVLFAGFPLVLTTLGFTFLGEALRDALDPRGRARRWG